MTNDACISPKVVYMLYQLPCRNRSNCSTPCVQKASNSKDTTHKQMHCYILHVIRHFGLLPCVRVRCRLYPHGLTVVLFWFAPLCERLLWTVSTFLSLNLSHLCFHLGKRWKRLEMTTRAACVCDVLVPCVRVRCRLYHMGCVCLWCTCLMRESLLRTVPHGLHVSVMYLSHAWESTADCITWATCVCDVLVPYMRVCSRLYHMDCVCLWCTCPVRKSPLWAVPHGLTVFYSLVFSLVCKSLLRTVSTCFFPCVSLLQSVHVS